jgi:hypothetical protein
LRGDRFWDIGARPAPPLKTAASRA